MARYFLMLFFIGILFGCKSPENNKTKGTALSGEFTIYSDEAFRPVISTLAASFMGQYKTVKINIVYGPDAGNIQRIASGDFESFVTSAAISSEDSSMLNRAKVFYHSFHFATDAVIAVRNINSTDTTFDITQQTAILCKGEDSLQRSSTVIYTDGRTTDNTNTVLEKIPYAEKCVNEWFACGSDTGVIGYLEKNNAATGFISYSLVCDKDDPEMMAIKKRIKILKLNNPGLDSIGYVYPTQASISSKNYPLTRKINLITTEPYAGPATGFAAYVASQEGQQIIRLLGIVPATMPTREVIIN